MNRKVNTTQIAIAVALGIARSNVTKLKKKGMPVDSVASAQAWREARKNAADKKRLLASVKASSQFKVTAKAPKPDPKDKVCSKCKTEKGLEHFYKNKNTGYFMSMCKNCFSEYAKKKTAKRQEERFEKYSAIKHECETVGMVCKKCLTLKNKNYFPINMGNITGRDGTCRDCQADKNRSTAKKSYERNKEKYKERVRSYAQNNRCKVNKYMRDKKAKMRSEIAVGYVKHLLKIKAKDVTDEMIKLKTEQIELKRLSRQIRNTLKEEKNETSANTD